MSLIDIGANLTHESFEQDLPEVLDSARSHNVTQLMVTGASVKGSKQAFELARQYPDFLYATAGIHPHHADEATAAGLAAIEALLAEPEVKAVGETGLDFFRDFSDRENQQASFLAHIELAKTHQLPMFLHERDAYPTFYDLLAPHRNKLGAIVVHCFTGQEDALNAYLDLDCHIGITGWICDERRGQHLIELVKQIPLNRIMLETDSPYLMPRTLKPKPKSRRNEPKHLAHICDFVAHVLGITSAQLADATSENAREFFSL
tara:strand:+ start:8763 stop:9548 length:786 start_codon:yes stop_codon:yes gene_type:complete